MGQAQPERNLSQSVETEVGKEADRTACAIEPVAEKGTVYSLLSVSTLVLLFLLPTDEILEMG